ncbi:chemotaxis protein CheB [Nostoc sp. ChiQUE01b]|uniref:chemotaxis protein CheB n=1 Tax=Nostoc sp. ChiQUE01b TaxID=3075376 RepID=UPI002AD24CC2|nr:chemotaxis protein CheB [Nostoc sp. ChiQUE01b]MDZ8261699.1 chemotaxis protein CheB [Nostoc sp. ChiQUE01b]
MPGHDIIVIGTSAGGLKALSTIISALPADIDAVLLIVQHLAANKPSLLPQILESVSSLSTSHPKDGEKIQKGHIYIAPPDHHLLVSQEHLRVVHGPHENRFRPAIDALFRSAAITYGPRVVGVILTGYLDDGTVGLQAVKKRGGVAIVQDPQEAQYPSMVKSALQFVKVDYCLTLAEIPNLLVHLTKEPAAEEKAYPIPKEMEIESNIALQQMNSKEFLENVEEIGTRTTYTCPQCHGNIWQIKDSKPLRFRCHTGHSFTADVLLSQQTENIENALWSAVRALEEKVTFSRQMAEQMKSYNLQKASKKYKDYARNLDKEVSIIRGLILNGFATNRDIVESTQEQQE